MMDDRPSMPVPGTVVPVPTSFTIPLDRNPDVRKEHLGADEPKATWMQPKDTAKQRAEEFEKRLAQLARTADGRALAREVVRLQDRVAALEAAIAPR